jgi:hypothetical protein
MIEIIINKLHDAQVKSDKVKIKYYKKKLYKLLNK